MEDAKKTDEGYVVNPDAYDVGAKVYRYFGETLQIQEKLDQIRCTILKVIEEKDKAIINIEQQKCFVIHLDNNLMAMRL